VSASAEPRRTGLPLRTVGKLYFFIALVTLALGGLVVRLTQIQLVDGAKFARAARANQIRRIPVSAPRGRIYDRHGTLLVRSRPSFVCAIVPSEVRDPALVVSVVARTLGLPESALWRRMLHHRGLNYKTFDELATYEPYGPVVPAANLTSAQMARLSEAQAELPGVDHEAQPVRDYPYAKLGAHVLGYVGSITEEEYRARKSRGYTSNDVVGKDLSLEQGCEAARYAAITTLAAVKYALGDLDRVQQIVHMLGFVNSAPGFNDQPRVINGAADLLVELFGERGRHARSAVGMQSLPGTAEGSIAVEIEMIAEIS